MCFSRGWKLSWTLVNVTLQPPLLQYSPVLTWSHPFVNVLVTCDRGLSAAHSLVNTSPPFLSTTSHNTLTVSSGIKPQMHISRLSGFWEVGSWHQQTCDEGHAWTSTQLPSYWVICTVSVLVRVLPLWLNGLLKVNFQIINTGETVTLSVWVKEQCQPCLCPMGQSLHTSVSFFSFPFHLPSLLLLSCFVTQVDL